MTDTPEIETTTPGLPGLSIEEVVGALHREQDDILRQLKVKREERVLLNAEIRNLVAELDNVQRMLNALTRKPRARKPRT